jgi:hypothetical protein
MFQNIREQDVVELPPVRKAIRFDIVAMKGVVIGAGLCCSNSIALDSREVMAFLPQDPAQVAGGAANVENAHGLSFSLELFQDPVMAAVLKILKDVATLRFSRRSQYTLR